MTVHLLRQIDKLKSMILSLGQMVQKSLADAIEAIENQDVNLAKEVIDGDEAIDSMEIDVEEECLHTLALHQPVAMDLRYVVAVLKINNDLERIADLAASIAGPLLSEDERPGLVQFTGPSDIGDSSAESGEGE